MNLVVDFGNTRAKVGIFYHGRSLEIIVLEKPDVKAFRKIADKYPLILEAAVCSVVNIDRKVMDFLRSRYYLIHISSKSALPFIIKYKTPETLGADRIAAIAGAHKIFPKKNILVIDVGTCIKYNFLNSKNEFIGGAISPGLEMRFKALHNFTARLPLVKSTKKTAMIGTTTEESIRSGVINGAVAELEELIRLYIRQHKVKVILTGGDAVFFVNRLKSSIFVRPELILTGLNYILENNNDGNS